MELDRHQLRTWLRTALDKTGDTPTSMARKAGVAQSTITRFLNSDDSPNLSLRSLAKIAHAANLQPPGLDVRKPHGATIVSGMREAEATPYHANAGQSPLDRALRALIGEAPATDAWQLKTDALTFAGYLPGDIVIVDLNGSAGPGDVVCAQVYRWQEGRAETVFRINEPPYLVAAGSDPTLRKPLLVDNDRVIIKGVVTGMLRPAR